VTVIEVVSPTNKIAGSRGQASYRQKRNEVMNSPSHFMEIDLLRQGVAFVSREVLPACDYLVHVSRVQRRPKAKIWLIRLQRRLPVVSVPLKADDPDAKMDLQEVLNTVYDRAAYDLAIDYRTDPVPPLNVDQAGWADELLRGKGLR